MEYQPVEIILNQMKYLNLSQLNKLCRSNERLTSICKENKEYIVNNILKQYGFTKFPSNLDYSNILKYLYNHDYEPSELNSIFSESVKDGHWGIVKFLVENKADIHAEDDAALRFSAIIGHFEIVKYLVEHGADIHAEDDYALIFSANNGYLKIVKYLVEHGANIMILH